MSKSTTREMVPPGGGSIDDRLARLLDTHSLARVVPHLPPETLHQLIRYRGLDACGEIVVSATPAQLTALLDLDLWRHARAGRDDLFDVERFGEWVDVLVEAGESVAARTVAALDPTLVVAGLSRYVRVLDPGIFEPTAPSDDEPADRHEAMREGDSVDADDQPDSRADGIECEVGGYIVRARRPDTWDAIVALLIALDAEHASVFHTVMRECRRLSNSRSEIDGLNDLLAAPEQQLHDVTVDREHRRSAQGYATPADARAFLQMARQPRHVSSGPTMTNSVNPIAAAYFRAADETPQRSAEAARSGSGANATDVPESVETIKELLAEAGVAAGHPRALLAGADDDAQAPKLTRLRQLMAYALDADEAAYFTRMRELAFLANTLLAGGSVQSRPFTPQEASDAAAAVCNLGLDHWPGVIDSWLIDHDLVTAFEVGWSVLHHDVGLFAAKQLIAMLRNVGSVDRDLRRDLVALRRALVTERDAGTPWRAREAGEVLAMLDMTAWIGVLGLLDECPVLAEALRAVLEGRTTTVSPTAFDFISTAAQISDVRAFMRKLPDVLGLG